MRSVEQVLGMWACGLWSVEQVIAWTHLELARLDEPPMALFDLASWGPQACLKRPESEFPYRPSEPGYLEQFAVRAIGVDLESRDSSLRFAEWAARHCIDADVSDPLRGFGYQLDHLLWDCHDIESALEFVRARLPSHLPRCRALADPLLQTGD
jgi:hypothetical protein